MNECQHCNEPIHQVKDGPHWGKVWIHTDTEFKACDATFTIKATPKVTK